MPRYFFNRKNGSVAKDIEGSEMQTISEARREAIVYAAETLKDRPELGWDEGEFQIEVTDENGTVLFVVTVNAHDVA